MKKDHVDNILNQWHDERPDLDVSPMGIVGRLFRLNKIFEKELQSVFVKYNLNFGEFDVLAVLLRTGNPYALTPNQLLSSLMLSSGAMTNRIDKLEKMELVHRKPDPNDRRGVLVTLSKSGLKLINEVVTNHVQHEHEILDCLNPSQQKNLAVLLKQLLLKYEA
ncbi:MAG: MarR family transcriptional regulator [SAR86 cluster bacterium]|uniref:MarR family transcriptional regulator n=1 Tax=SAR86 cluster bacterium TaxID=2030880 RepID=A0A2A4MVA2_9GAMM|nr:MAG: MarR family transcriptional regulator [SAR86 cluster bacterium]